MSAKAGAVVAAAVGAWCDQNHTTRLAAAFWAATDETARERVRDAVAVIVWGIVGPNCQGGPDPESMARLMLGDSPYDIAGRVLTRKEAHEWIQQDEHATPSGWLWARVRAENPEIPNTEIRSLSVIRWVASVMQSPERKAAALRHREGVIAGHAVGGRPIDRLDEIQPCDLRKSVTGTIEAAAERLAREQWDGPDVLCEPKPWEARLPDGVRCLRTFVDLMTEGQEMSHCVAVYAESVHRLECSILSIQTGKGRSTAELRGGRIVQHVGPRNSAPHPSCVALLNGLQLQ